MKPIICWYCARLGKCMDYNKDGCEKFVMWKLTFKEVATMCHIDERTLYKWFEKSEKKALEKIYTLTGCKFRTMYVTCKRVLHQLYYHSFDKKRN